MLGDGIRSPVEHSADGGRAHDRRDGVGAPEWPGQSLGDAPGAPGVEQQPAPQVLLRGRDPPARRRAVAVQEQGRVDAVTAERFDAVRR